MKFANIKQKIRDLVLDKDCEISKRSISLTKLKNVFSKLPSCGFNQGATNALKFVAELTEIHAVNDLIGLRSFDSGFRRQLIGTVRIIRSGCKTETLALSKTLRNREKKKEKEKDWKKNCRPRRGKAWRE